MWDACVKNINKVIFRKDFFHGKIVRISTIFELNRSQRRDLFLRKIRCGHRSSSLSCRGRHRRSRRRRRRSRRRCGRHRSAIAIFLGALLNETPGEPLKALSNVDVAE